MADACPVLRSLLSPIQEGGRFSFYVVVEGERFGVLFCWREPRQAPQTGDALVDAAGVFALEVDKGHFSKNLPKELGPRQRLPPA